MKSAHTKLYSACIQLSSRVDESSACVRERYVVLLYVVGQKSDMLGGMDREGQE